MTTLPGLGHSCMHILIKFVYLFIFVKFIFLNFLFCVIRRRQFEGSLEQKCPWHKEALPPGSSGSLNYENDQEERTNDDIPECWTKKQAKEKKELYPWLLYQGKALGCSTCNKVNAAGSEMGGKHKHVAKEWIMVKVVASGITKSARQQSLCKKIHHHRTLDFQWKP